MPKESKNSSMISVFQKLCTDKNEIWNRIENNVDDLWVIYFGLMLFCFVHHHYYYYYYISYPKVK